MINQAWIILAEENILVFVFVVTFWMGVKGICSMEFFSGFITNQSLR
jgi:hypothetical protein